MTRRKRPPLTQKREEYVDQRARGVLVGKPLHYPAGVEDRYRSELDRLIRIMTRAYEREMNALWKELPPIAMDASLASQSRIALNKLKSQFAKLFRDAAPSITERMLGGVDKASASSLKSSLKELSGGVTLKTDTMPAALAESMKAASAENVSLIKSVAAQYHERIEGAVMRSIQQGGEGRKTIMEELENIGGMSVRRAQIIARDQTAKATTANNAFRAQELGIKKFRWQHSGGGVDKRIKHVEASGKIFEYANPPRIGDKGEPVLPGQAISCHPGESELAIPNGCVKLYRRRYAGELISLISDDGVILKATPNHPILTAEGWKAAKDVDLGDHLIKGTHQSVNFIERDVKNSVSLFSEAFDAASHVIGLDASYNAGNTSFEFHGDASDSEVDVVDIGRFLPDEGDPRVIEKLRELILAFADVMCAGPGEGSQSSSHEGILAALLAPDSIMRGLGPLLSELRGEPARAYDACLRLITHLDSAFEQDAVYRDSGDPIFLRQLKLAHSCDVFQYDLIVRQILAIVALGFGSRDRQSPGADRLGEVVGIDSKIIGDLSQTPGPIEHLVRVTNKVISEDFCGHVYNLETVSNWYEVNGIVTHNCRCIAVPVVEWGEDDE